MCFMGKMIDLMNQRFGKLTVIANAGKLDGRRYFWTCKCDCGNIITIQGTYLRNGNTKSCGCGKYDGLIVYNKQQSEQAKIPLGTKFGKLTVIEDLGFREHVPGHNRRWYKCQCDCGNIKEATGNALKSGHIISCGKCLISKGEYLICQILDEYNVLYDHDIMYIPLYQATNKKLRFDFIIYNTDGTINRFVEFDGRQHIDGPDPGIWRHNTQTLEEIQYNDNLKNQFCINNNMTLIRIPYYIQPTYEIIFSDKYKVKE